MKKYHLIVFTAIFGFLIYAQQTHSQQETNPPANEKELVLYNWEDYMPEAVLDAFFQETGYRVTQVYYETDELKDELIYATQGKGMDLVIGSGFSFNRYAQRGNLLADIPLDAFPNRKHIAPRWLADSPKISNLSAPLLWGTLGIIYRKDLVTTPVTSWMSLLQPDEALKDKIIMIDDARDSMAAALMALNYSLNTSSVAQITEAGRLLKSQQPFVKAYRYISLNENSELLSGAVHMTLGYNGDALILKDLSDDIAYFVPEQGTELWVDHIGVFQHSDKKEAAFKFINFIHEPRRAAFIAEALSTASTNQAAEQFMSQEHLNNPLIYPPKSVIEKSEFLQELSPRATSMFNTIFINITR